MKHAADTGLDRLAMVTPDTTNLVDVSHLDRASPEVTEPAAPLAVRLADYVARVGLLRGAENLGVARHTLERALGGLRVIRAIERQLLDVLDRDDRARASQPEGPSDV
jgi:hypothetical protein